MRLGACFLGGLRFLPSVFLFHIVKRLSFLARLVFQSGARNLISCSEAGLIE